MYLVALDQTAIPNMCVIATYIYKCSHMFLALWDTECPKEYAIRQWYNIHKYALEQAGEEQLQNTEHTKNEWNWHLYIYL